MRFRKKTLIQKHKKESLKSIIETVHEENVASECSHSYGYLAVRPKKSSIPQECLCCLKVIDCLYKTKK